MLFFVFSYMSLFGVPAGSGSPRPLEAALSDTLQIISSDTSRTATDSIYPDTVLLFSRHCMEMYYRHF